MKRHNKGKHCNSLYCTNNSNIIRKTSQKRKRTKLRNRKLSNLIIIFIIVSFFINVKNIYAYFFSNASIINTFFINAEYTVSFDKNGGIGTMENQVISYNVQTALLPNNFSKQNYVFKEWNTESDGSGTSYENEDEVLNLNDITLYAQWMLQEYNITYILRGGTIENSNPITYTVETDTFTLNNPVKEGATFKGWSGTELEGDTNLIVTIPKGSTGDRTYTANWEEAEESRKIIYNSNSGSGSMADQTVTVDESTNLTLNAFTKSNYVFKEWNTNSDGSGTRYLDGQEITLLEDDFNDNNEFVLYAQWVQGVAIIDGESEVYDTLQGAINAVPTNTEKTVRLLTNVSEFIKVGENKNIILDLQRYTLKEPSSKNSPVIENKGTLKISNGILSTLTTTAAVINNESTGRLYISGGRIENNNSSTGKQGIYNNNGYVEISGNAYISAQSKARATVQNLASGELVIKGGSIYATGNQNAVNNEGTLVVGEKDGVVSITSPIIQSETVGINSSVGYSFYDGIIIGKTNAVNNQENITDIEEDYYLLNLTETINGVTYKSLSLSNQNIVTFDSIGGDLSEEHRRIDSGDPIGELPVPIKPGYDFLGWYTLENGGEQISSSTIVTGDITYYAHWNKLIVADVNGVQYYTLQEAINSVPKNNTETTIRVINDTREALKVSSGQNIVLDLEDHELSLHEGGNVIDNRGTLSISNGKISSTAPFGTIDNKDNGVLKISGGIIIHGDNRPAVYNEKGTVEISGGYFSSTAVGRADNVNLERGTVQNRTNGVMTITGGTIVGMTQTGLANEGILTLGVKQDGINNGDLEIIGKTYGVLSVGTLKIYDGIIKGVTEAISGQVSEIEDNSQITTTSEVIDGYTYEVKYLSEIE